MCPAIRCWLPLALGVATLAVAGSSYAQTDDACIAASEKALTLRKAGKLLDARKELSTCAASSCPDVVKVSCQQRLGELNQSLPSIVFDVKDASGRDLANVRLAVDGAPYSDKLGGAAISLDPGDHEFRFEVVDQTPVVRHFVLREGEKNRREPIVVGSVAAPATPPPSPRPMVTPPPAPAPPPPTAPPPATTTPPPITAPPPTTPAALAETSSGSSQRTIGIVVGVAGLGGIVLGSAFGAIASSKWSSAQSECPAAGCAQHAQAVSDHDSAASAATVSTIGFVAGGVALAAGAILFFTASSGSAATGGSVGVRLTPSVGPGSGGFLLQGIF